MENLNFDIADLLRFASEGRASDLHLTEGSPPILRIDGKIEYMALPVLTRYDTKRMIYSLLNERQIEQFEAELELNFSFAIEKLNRFRANVHMQRGSVEAAFRVIPFTIRSMRELDLPISVMQLARKREGLVLVTGPTGMGKTTTLASMVDLINEEHECVITCIEDPIEYVHKNKHSIIKQREVYSDTRSFAHALRNALRQDPDVIVVGEMRDLETISTALTAAETGHLVLATLHTADAVGSITRIIDVFSPHQQQQIKVQLAGCLQGVISQQLLPRQEGRGLALSCEVLVATSAVRKLIRDNQMDQLYTVIQTGSQHGMKTMDKSLKELFNHGTISYDVAVSRLKYLADFMPAE